MKTSLSSFSYDSSNLLAALRIGAAAEIQLLGPEFINYLTIFSILPDSIRVGS